MTNIIPTPKPGYIPMGVAPTTADGFFQMFQNKNDLTWSGGDQVTSFSYNGFTYWLFGDTMLSSGENPDGSYPADTTMVSNRILMQSGDQLTNAMAVGGDGVPDAPSYTDENKRRYWTQSMFAANGYLYVLAHRVETDTDPNSMGFKSVGVDMAKYTQGVDGRLTLVSIIATPSTAVPGSAGPLNIHFSGDAVVNGGFVYIYGNTLAQGNPYVIHYGYVARVPVAKLENPYAWQYYAKSSGTWKNKMSDLDRSNLADQADSIIGSQISSVRFINNKYVILHKPWNGWGSTVYAMTSTSPVGPFTQTAIFESPEGVWNGHAYITYSPQLHPEQTLTSGKTLVSIAWNGKTWTDLMADADIYKPRFYEVQF